MNAITSLKLFEITQEFIKDKDKAQLFVSKIEETIDEKFENEKDRLATKDDISNVRQEIAEVRQEIADSKSELIKWMFIFWVGQILAILAIINFMNK